MTQLRARGSVYLGLAAGLFVASGGLLGGYFLLADERPTAPGPAGPAGPAGVEGDAAEAAVKVDPALVAQVLADAEAALSDAVVVRFGGEEKTLTWSELGITADAAQAEAVAAQPGVAGRASAGELALWMKQEAFVPVSVDRDAALERLLALKRSYDRSPIDARMDLEARTIEPHQDGFVIDAYAAIGAIDAAARAAAAEVELPGLALPAQVTTESLGIDDISHVLASFTTPFAVNERERNYNLKLAAAKLNGHVIEAGANFSFNEVLGPRTDKEGYKIAGVITAGEMVDGLAGGTCQISSTLHGAAFFAGLDIVRAIPHSRPSSYVQMGLDATVWYDAGIDLRLRNPYDFPVVIRYRVARGQALVEILGRERPYDQIAFEREVEEEIPFDTITRDDDTMPVGTMTIDQLGFPGYKLTRYRRFIKDGKVVKTDQWKLQYRPVTEYARMGINPDPNLPAPAQNKPRGLRPPRDARFRMVQ